MGMETTGRIHALMDVKEVGKNNFRIREFVLEVADNPRYPQYVLFQMTGDRSEGLDGYSVGDEVKVEFSLRGREWQSPKGETRYFNSLDVWTIERLGASASGFEEQPPPPDDFPPPQDDVPF